MDDIEDENLSVNWGSKSSNSHKNSIKSSNSLVKSKGSNGLDLENIFNNFKFTFNSTIKSSDNLLKSPTKSLFGQTNIDALVDELDIASNSSSNSLQTEQAKKKLKLSDNLTSSIKDLSLFEPSHKSDRDILKEANQFMDLLRFNDSDNSPFKTSTPVNDDISLLKLRDPNHFDMSFIPKSKSHNDFNQPSIQVYHSATPSTSKLSQFTCQKAPGPTSLKFVEPNDYPYKEEYGNYVFDRHLKKWLPRSGFYDSDSDADPFEGIESLGEEPKSSLRNSLNRRSAFKGSSTNTPLRSVSFKHPSPKSLRKSSLKNQEALRNVFNSNIQNEMIKSSPASEFFRSDSLSRPDSSSLFHRTLSELSNQDITQEINLNLATKASFCNRSIQSLVQIGLEAGNLQYLDLSKNKITCVKPLKSLLHLRHLNLDDNKLHSLEGLDGIKGLQKLSVSRNVLHALDFSNYQWQEIEYMDLSNNEIIGIRGIEELKNLSFLSLDSNFLKELKLNAKFDHLKVLRVSNNRLKTLDVRMVTKVRTLFIDNNKLSALSGISELKKLENLSCREQKGEYFELSMKDIRDIKRLYLSGNNLPETFPAECCYHLEYLEIANCGLRALPKNFSEVCPNLRVLNINMNPIKDVETLTNLNRLQRLSINRCDIENIDIAYEVISSLIELEVLDLRDNPCTRKYYVDIKDERTKYAVAIPAIRVKRRSESIEKVEEWIKMDKEYVEMEMKDEDYIKRIAYRGIMKSVCNTLKVLDGISITSLDEDKAVILTKRLKQLEIV
ncbi:hypothetical protein E3P91_02751 [Wallemia ichthyophaga]|nr:hypothetical protein E3P91_02751 [Wallemia ichthyophaga]TIB61150.1 hypothetical protein E3P78_02898 [Wallemia ichthyophaga]